jgi:hypothetical protein
VIPVIGSEIFLTYNKEESEKDGRMYTASSMVDGVVNSVRYVYEPTAEDDCVIVTVNRY